MATYQKMGCKDCKYYESYHQYPNPNSVARHYCKKCHEEIEYRREFGSDFFVVWLPKTCYFNNYFEESEEAKKQYEVKHTYFEFGLACQIED